MEMQRNAILLRLSYESYKKLRNAKKGLEN